MQIKSVQFVKSAAAKSGYPPKTVPEIAFAGRSNVGKSSLINVLVNRKKLVKTSSTPGRTRLINFFSVNDSILFVDLPGYGYARVPANIRKQWKPMVETYLSGRTTLAGVVLILDIRRTPQPETTAFIDWLNMKQTPMIPVITKVDKLSKIKQQKQLKLISNALGRLPEELIPFSAKTRIGKNSIWEAIERLSGVS